MSQTIVALFDTLSNAEAVVQTLIQANVPRASIRVVPGRTGIYKGALGYNHTLDEGGFWAALKDVLVPDEDRYAYAEGLSRGNALAVINTDEAQVHRIEEIIEGGKGTIDVDQQEIAWRAAGWTGYHASTASSGLVGSTAAKTEIVATGDDATINLYEERLNVGKRVIDRGRVRLRSYVVETPVSEQVTLRDETIHIDRHPVDHAVAVGDAAFSGDRVIEAEEHDEEAVIAKEVRVKEEIGLRKTVEDRTQMVSDKVRRTEVEIEDTRVAESTTSPKANLTKSKPV